MMNLKIQKLFYFSFTLFLIACTSNNFNEQETLVENPGTVNTTVYTSAISLVGQFIVIPNQGSKGIIVFNTDGSNFRAYDLGCPYLDPDDCDTPMEVNVATGEMSCEGCTDNDDEITFTQYKTNVAIDGKNYYLREYYATLEGSVVRITNY